MQQAETVPVSILRKKERTERIKKLKQEFQQKEKERKENKKQVIFKRAEDYVREYRENEKIERLAIAEAEKNGDYYVPEEAKVIFVIRIKGINKIPSDRKKTLYLLRLRRLHSGVFLKVNKATMQMIKKIEPYITYGEPTLENIRRLIYSRGFGTVEKDRIRITDNDIVEEQLGGFGLICIEDIVHEIFTVGPHFKEANNFLWPFALNSPLKGFGNQKKVRHFVEGGAHGNREKLINELIEKML